MQSVLYIISVLTDLFEISGGTRKIKAGFAFSPFLRYNHPCCCSFAAIDEAEVAQLVEPLVVVQVVAGSSPVFRPK